jgi:MFS family permease
VLLWSIAASAAGMTLLGLSGSVLMLFVARLFSGMATANIAVAQAYIADVTTPERRARGMGLIGMAFGLGFIFGPFIGGELGRFAVLGHPGALAAFVAAGLSAINFVMAWLSLPESLPPERRSSGRRPTPLDPESLRLAGQAVGVPLAIAVGFFVIFWFAGMEQTFRLFTEDAFGLGVAATGRVFGLVGICSAIVQGGLLHRLTRRFGEVRLLRAGAPILGLGLGLLALSPGMGGRGLLTMITGSGVLAVGYGLITPSLSSYISRQTGPQVQGAVLGVYQSTGALARVLGPAVGGLLYQFAGMRAPYAFGAAGMVVAFLLTLRLPALTTPSSSARSPDTAAPAPR